MAVDSKDKDRGFTTSDGCDARTDKPAMLSRRRHTEQPGDACAGALSHRGGRDGWRRSSRSDSASRAGRTFHPISVLCWAREEIKAPFSTLLLSDVKLARKAPSIALPPPASSISNGIRLSAFAEAFSRGPSLGTDEAGLRDTSVDGVIAAGTTGEGLLYTGMHRAHSTSLYLSFPLDGGAASSGHEMKSYSCSFRDLRACKEVHDGGCLLHEIPGSEGRGRGTGNERPPGNLAVLPSSTMVPACEELPQKRGETNLFCFYLLNSSRVSSAIDTG